MVVILFRWYDGAMKLLVTHHAPDIDAITAIWLFKRFDSQNFADAKIAFVDAGETIDPSIAKEHGVESMDDVVHVDTGMGELDHHQKERGMQRICASSLVLDRLLGKHSELKENPAVKAIVEFANVDDHFEAFFWPEAGHDRHLFMLRGILHGLEFTHLHDDDSQTSFGMRCLDGIYASLQEKYRAEKEIRKGVEFETIWGKAIGIETGNQGVLKQAQLQGYNLVIQKDPKYGNIRIKAAPLPEIDLTPLYKKILEKDTIGSWFFHAGKHMVLNGSNKATQKPSPLSLQEVMEIAKSVQGGKK